MDARKVRILSVQDLSIGIFILVDDVEVRAGRAPGRVVHTYAFHSCVLDHSNCTIVRLTPFICPLVHVLFELL